MKYRKLGKSGLSVSNLTLGTMGFGSETSEKDSFAILDAFIDAGGKMIDTADVYGGGASEELLGRWLSKRSDKTNHVVLATKARFGTGPDINDCGSSRPHLHRALDTSLRRLGAESIDLYQLHGWDPLTPVEETLSFLDTAIRAGKINYIGLSNFTGWQLQLFIGTAQAMGIQPPVTLQQQYSLMYRENEYEVIPAALHNGVGLLPWSPLAGGFLSGKYSRETAPKAPARLNNDDSMTRHISATLRGSDRNWAILDCVQRIANDLGITPSQVALSWLANKPSVTSPIFGARTMEQFIDNMKAADLDLPAEAIANLDSLSAPTPDDYPYGKFGVLQRKRYIDSSEQALGELSD
ncbi:aldo/keto reductase [Pseudomonas syringae group genomosp. 3]|nr:aldo/keto reductase [Pseudomonas syringae group genomosp. 3]